MGRKAVGLLAIAFILGCARAPDNITVARENAREACKDHGGTHIHDIAKKQVKCRDGTNMSL